MANNTLLLISVIITLLLTPFIVCSLYYGFQDTSCANKAVTKFSIVFDLGTWLKIDGFTDLVFVSVLLLVGIGSVCGECSNCSRLNSSNSNPTLNGLHVIPRTEPKSVCLIASEHFLDYNTLYILKK